MTDWTSISVTEEQKEYLDKSKPEGMTMGKWLRQLAQEHNDPVTMHDAAEIAEAVKNEISMANEPGVEVDTKELIREIRKLQELVEQAPNKTADRFEEKYR